GGLEIGPQGVRRRRRRLAVAKPLAGVAQRASEALVGFDIPVDERTDAKMLAVARHPPPRFQFLELLLALVESGHSALDFCVQLGYLIARDVCRSRCTGNLRVKVVDFCE